MEEQVTANANVQNAIGFDDFDRGIATAVGDGTRAQDREPKSPEDLAQIEKNIAQIAIDVNMTKFIESLKDGTHPFLPNEDHIVNCSGLYNAETKKPLPILEQAVLLLDRKEQGFKSRGYISNKQLYDLNVNPVKKEGGRTPGVYLPRIHYKANETVNALGEKQTEWTANVSKKRMYSLSEFPSFKINQALNDKMLKNYINTQTLLDAEGEGKVAHDKRVEKGVKENVGVMSLNAYTKLEDFFMQYLACSVAGYNLYVPPETEKRIREDFATKFDIPRMTKEGEVITWKESKNVPPELVGKPRLDSSKIVNFFSKNFDRDRVYAFAKDLVKQAEAARQAKHADVAKDKLISDITQNPEKKQKPRKVALGR